MTEKNPTVDEQDPTSPAETDLDVENTQEEELSDEESLQKKLQEVVQVQVEDIGPLRKQVTITVPRDAIDERLQEQYDELRQEAAVPGFRKGRAPMKLIEKRFGTEVGDQVSSSLIGNSYLAAMKRESLDVLGDPLVRVKVKEKRRDEGATREIEVEKLMGVDEALKHLALPKDGDLTYTCEIEIKPEFELPNLDKIPVEKPKIAIDDDDVEKEIKRRMALRGKFVPVEDGQVEADDVLVGPTKVTVDGDTIAHEDNAELAARDQNYDGYPLTGFGDAAVGCKAGDTVAVEVTVPDDHQVVSARGKQAKFELSIQQVKRLEVPELDDEFIASLGFEKADEFRTLVKEQMERAVDHEVKRMMKAQIERYLLDSTKFEIPQGISQRHTERIVARQMMEQYTQGVSEAEISKHADELRMSASAQAANDIRYMFIMSKIAEKQEIQVTEEEINAAIAEIAYRRGRRFDRVRDEIIGTNHLMTLYSRLRDEKILDRLLEGAEVTEKTVEAAKEKKSADAAAPKKKATRKKKADQPEADAE